MSNLIPFDLEGHRKGLEKLMKPIERHVLDGKCGTFEEYKSKTGELRGYQSALAEIQQTMKRSEDDDG